MLVHVVLGEAARRQGLESGFNSSFRGGFHWVLTLNSSLRDHLSWRGEKTTFAEALLLK